MTAISPVRPITCAILPGGFRRGGSLPSGVPVPQAVPKLTCVGAHRAVAVLWTSVAPSQYEQELSSTGWHASGSTYTKAHVPRTITVLSIRSALVAIYRPS
ncbi:MAG TPA: hypothetical protein VGH43_06230 [Jatrophihabitans sp.]|jgi:hypothetical protein